MTIPSSLCHRAVILSSRHIQLMIASLPGCTALGRHRSSQQARACAASVLSALMDHRRTCQRAGLLSIQFTEAREQMGFALQPSCASLSRNLFVGLLDPKADVPAHRGTTTRRYLKLTGWRWLQTMNRSPYSRFVLPDSHKQQPAAHHPEPAHTGFKALVFEIGVTSRPFPDVAPRG